MISPGLPSAGAALDLADRISARLQHPATIGALTVAVAASIGVSSTSTRTASELLGAADAAMYAAKHAELGSPILLADPPS